MAGRPAKVPLAPTSLYASAPASTPVSQGTLDIPQALLSSILNAKPPQAASQSSGATAGGYAAYAPIMLPDLHTRWQLFVQGWKPEGY